MISFPHDYYVSIVTRDCSYTYSYTTTCYFSKHLTTQFLLVFDPSFAVKHM